ncbi:MAG: alpha/beta fold hydrolase [Leptolyngbyaceae cyanobacterium CSU_1_4]|nr:alpha/beta fold hydrolase [Leptolyngbyaceae cyanobacterium CSU_1_4]
MNVPSPNPYAHRSSQPFGQFYSQVAKIKRLIRGLTYGVAFSLGVATPGQAAEYIAVRLGPLQQSVAIADLQKFAQTGEVPASLHLLTPLLTAEVQQALSTRLQLDPNVGDKLVEDLLHSSAGERFINTLQVAIPDSNPAQLQQALTLAAKQPDQMSLLGFLESFPEKTVTIDASSVITLASQLNLPYWQSQTLSSIVDRDLTVQGKPLPTGLDPTQPGNSWVQHQTIAMRDYERDRTVPVDMYWGNETQGPLVILSHGFGADRRFLTYLAEHLASHGLTVVALEHPGSSVAWLTSSDMGHSATQGNNLLPATEFVDRPKDVSFVLDRLRQLDQFSAHLRGKFNTEEVTLIGHSLGGYTALALAGAKLSLKHLQAFCDDPKPVVFSPADLLQCNAADLPETPLDLQDNRIKQAIILNPVIGRLFDETGLAQVQIPTLMLASTDDAITPAVSQQFLPFTHLQTSKYLLTAIGGTHLSAGDPTNLNHSLTQSIFVRERSAEATEPLRNLLKGVSLAFIKQLTPQAKEYVPFLKPTYAQSFSTDTLKLRLNADLPPNFSNWLRVAALPMEKLVASTLPSRQAALCTDLECILNHSLPLVMFILPGDFPLMGHPFRQFRRKRKK